MRLDRAGRALTGYIAMQKLLLFVDKLSTLVGQIVRLAASSR